MLAVLAQMLEHAWLILPNMLAVLVAALVSVVAVSFFRGETTVFTTTSQLVIFVAAVISPFLVLAGASPSLPGLIESRIGTSGNWPRSSP